MSRSGRTCAADASIARVIQFFRLGTGGTRPAQRSASLQPLEPLPYFGAAEIQLSSDNSRMAILSRAHENSYQPLSPTIHTATWITREKSRLVLYLERKVKPRRASDATRLTLVFLSRL